LGAEPGQFREVTTNRTYVIDVDVSWLLQSKLQNVTALTKQVEAVANILKVFADYGFTVRGRHESN